jgi:hypothetical protein
MVLIILSCGVTDTVQSTTKRSPESSAKISAEQTSKRGEVSPRGYGDSHGEIQSCPFIPEGSSVIDMKAACLGESNMMTKQRNTPFMFAPTLNISKRQLTIISSV